MGVYKPAASGCRRVGEELVSDDAVALWEAAGRPGELDWVCPQRFEAPLAPHLAARAEGKQLDPELMQSGIERWRASFDIIVVEGAGGLMSPLGDNLYVADLARAMGFPLIVVASNALGVINQTLQTLIAAETFHDGLDVAGIVLNHPTHEPEDRSTASNRRELETHCRRPLLGEVAWRGRSARPRCRLVRAGGRRRSMIAPSLPIAAR